MSIELKIKSKHLSTEPSIIRLEVRKLRAQIRALKNTNRSWSQISDKTESLYQHIKSVIRPESRATFLARAYIAGKPYSHVEQKRLPEHEQMFQNVVIPRIVTMVNKYHIRSVTKEQVQKWTLT